MKVAAYLPSRQFSVIVVSVAAAGILVLVAQYATRPPVNNAAVVSANQPVPEPDWKSALDAVQSQAPGLPEAPSEDTVQALLKEAQSSNITSSVARSLFVNLGNAGAQGMGSDIPTQEKLISDAAARIGSIKADLYVSADLNTVPQSKTSLKTWGNAVMKAFVDQPKASNDEALYAVGYAMDHKDSSALSALTGIGQAYEAVAAALIKAPVPSTMAPLHLQLANNLLKMAAATAEMKTVVDDPLRGLSGLQAFQSAGREAARVLTTMKQQLSKGGILFTKDEPGNLWSSFPDSP